MGWTNVKSLQNDTDHEILAHLNDVDPPPIWITVDKKVVCPPGKSTVLDWNLPWVTSSMDFGVRHIVLEIPTGTEKYWIYQGEDRDGDFVRYLTNRTFIQMAPVVPGVHDVNGDRVIMVKTDGSFEFGY